MESGQETDPSRDEPPAAARPKGPVEWVKATWLLLTPEKKREVLLAFEDAYDNHSELGFGSELQADAALFWVVRRLHGRRSWRNCEGILDGLRERLTLVFKHQEPYQSAVTRLAADAAEVTPKAVLKEIKRADKKAYDALMVRQNAGFAAFYHWVKDKGLKAAPYVLVLLVLLRFGRFKKAAAATAVVVCFSVFAWCRPGPGPDHQSKLVAAPPPPGTQSTADLTDATKGSGEGASASVAPASEVAQRPSSNNTPLYQDPFFRLMSLSQDVAGKRRPGHAPEILRQGWEDYSDLTSVPAEHAEQWRRVQDLDRQAAAAFDEGRYEAALELYKQLIATKNQASGWSRLSGGIDIDDYVTLAIARRGHTPYLRQGPGLDGPAVLGLKQYELGRMYEDLGDFNSAVAEYGSCIWRHLVVPENVQAIEADNLAASNWHHLGDLRQIYNDASARAFGLAAELSAERHVLLSKDFALWLTSQGLAAISLSPRVPAVCAAFDRGPDLPSHNMGEDWRISTDYDDVAYEQKDLSFVNSGIVIRPAAPPAAPTRKTLVVHWRLMTDDPERAACRDVATRIDFCFFPDGSLKDVLACP